MTTLTSTRTKPMTRSGKTRRFQRTVSDVIARNDDDGDDNANDDEEQKRDDHDEQARPRRDPGNDVDQAPAGGHQEQASAPSADETAPTVEDPDDEGTRDESSPEAPRMTTGAGRDPRDGTPATNSGGGGLAGASDLRDDAGRASPAQPTNE
ncbi:hypothetical protein ON010_g12153 [Phytophthora cinnamomi]|nr:hypothetical protein ON010_g12153 [Phytophthora cinnamomi]